MVREGVTLLDAVRRAGIDLETPCGGKGNCKQCRVSILSGKAKIRADDAPFFSRVEITQGYLLACRTRVVADMNASYLGGIRIYRCTGPV
jgi:Na+-transporting NADH:ubiquinone oxidoreductase subunit NqrF